MKKISLVLSGGGARGIAHIGVINYLESKGYVIENVAGTSMGAIVGAIYSAGKLKDFENFLLDLDAKTIIKLLDFSLSRPGIIEGNKIIQKLKEFIPVDSFEALHKNYLCIATDLYNQKEMVWKSGDLLTAVHSSFAIPFVFDPVKYQGKFLVDGGVVNNIPLNHINRELMTVAVCANASIGMDILPTDILQPQKKYKEKKNIVETYLNKFLKKKKGEKSPGYYEILDQTLHLMIEQNSKNIINRYPPDYLVEIPRKIAGTFDFLKARQLIKAGEFLAEKVIP